MNFREYKNEDANEIIKWIRNEKELIFWSADVYNKFPLDADDINNFYNLCKEKNNFYPMTLEDNNKVIGHLILRNPGDDNRIIRLGFVIVNPEIRGQGYGKKILNDAIEYAKNTLNAKEINLGVFEENQSAYYCYKSVGFIEDSSKEKETFKFNDRELNCVELKLEE